MLVVGPRAPKSGPRTPHRRARVADDDRASSIARMTNLKLIALACAFFVGACNCGEPLHTLPVEEPEPDPLPVDYDDDAPAPALLEGEGVALEERAPIVVSTCGNTDVK